MRRTAKVLLVCALAPLLVFALAPSLMGDGGGFTGIPTGTVLSTEAISAFIVLDPHNCKEDIFTSNPPSNVTTTCKQAFITLRDTTKSLSQPLYAQASFKILKDFNLSRGCNLSDLDGVPLTNRRFLNVSFDEWMHKDFMATLFRQLGRTVSDEVNVPVITKVLNSDTDTGKPGQCMPDPANKGPLDSGAVPGWLYIEAEVRFAVPPKK